MRVSPTAAVAAALAAAVLASCGGGEDDPTLPPDPPDIEALVDYLPDDAHQMHAVDLVALRSELGLRADADPTVYPKPVKDMTRAEMLFSGGAMSSLPYAQFAASASFDPAKTPLSTAIDHSRAGAAVSAQTPAGFIAVIAVDQPFEAIADGLADQGWTPDGEVMASPDDNEAIRFAAEGEDGEIVVATNGAQLDAAVGGENDGSPAGAMMGGIGGSLRFALAEVEDRGCVTAVAGGIDVRRGRGTVLVDGGDDPDPAGFETATADAKGVAFGQPEAIGNFVRAPFTEDSANPGVGIDRAEGAVWDLVFRKCS